MNKTEETKTFEEILTEIENDIHRKWGWTDDIVRKFGRIKKLFEKQSQSPDKEQPRELQELLDKHYPIESEERYKSFCTGYNDMPYYVYTAERNKQRQEATTWYFAGLSSRDKKGWISVNEALKTGYYWVIDPNGLTGNETRTARYSSYNKSWHLVNGDCIHPTHFMEIIPFESPTT